MDSHSNPTWIYLLATAFVAVLAIYGIGVYNNLVRLRTNIKKAFANIDVLLRQRHDEVPNLAEICRGAMDHERETFESLAAMRSRYDRTRRIPGKTQIENVMGGEMNRLLALAEGYPELKSSESLQALQARIQALEEAIADRREYFNDSVGIYNTFIARFPELLVARPLGFGAYPFLKAPEESRATPRVQDSLG